MAYSQFDYTLVQASARAQRQVLWERQRAEKERLAQIAAASQPIPPTTFTKLFNITPTPLKGYDQ
jgi:hypothetical protein